MIRPTPGDQRAGSPFGNYPGCELDHLECERLALTHIPKSLLKKEARLFDSKWFDYVDLHPTQATLLFAHEFTRQYARSQQRRVDVDRGHYMRPYSGQTIFDGKLDLPRKKPGVERTEEELAAAREAAKGKGKTQQKRTFWRARQACDEHGMPYDFLAREVMLIAERSLWHRPPLPTHCYKGDLFERVLERWQERLRVGIPRPLSSAFYAAHYEGTPEQQRFQAWLLDQIEARTNPDLVLGTFLVVDPLVVRKHAVERFGEFYVARAESLCQ